MRLKALADIYTMHSFAQLCISLIYIFKNLPKMCESCKNQQTFQQFLTQKIEIRERCKGVHCVDLGESFPTSIYLQTLASIQPRTSLVKFARSPRTDPPGNPTEDETYRRRIRNWTSRSNRHYASLFDRVHYPVGADPADYNPLEHVRYPRSRPARSVPASQNRAVLPSPRELRRSHRRVLIGGNSAVR